MKKSVKLTFIGIFLGLPVSYWFQSEMVRGKLSLCKYLLEIPQMIFDVEDSFFNEGDLLGTVVLSCLIMGIIGGIIGYFVDKNNEKSNP